MAEPVATYTYVDARGLPCLIVRRFHDADSTRPEGYKKRFTQSTKDDAGKWIPKNPKKNADGSPRFNPLYKLPSIVDDPDAAILVVEGEKAWEGAQAYLPDGWIATTWSGGSSAVKYTDWTPLRGRRVVVWPDHDVAGMKAAHAIGAALEGVPVVKIPEGVPEGWDLGDPLPDALTFEQVQDLILTARVEEPAPAPEHLNGHAVAAVEPPEGAVPGASSAAVAKYRALGYKEGRFFFFSSRTNNIHDFASKDLRSGNGLRDLEPDELYWARIAPTTQHGIPWKQLGDMVIAECYKLGIYKDSNLRARGVWLDPSLATTAEQPVPVVAHMGDSILVDGAPLPSIEIPSRFTYPVDEPLLPEAPPDVPALTDDEGSDLRYLCRYLPWVNNTSGDLLAGLIATSCICGALQFRTHGWITGPAGSGKSTIMEQVVARALEGVALHILGNSTEAGIRRHLSRDARPAIYDEAEGEGRHGQARRDMIIAFMRAASTETKARILLGSGGPTGESFPVRAQFILGSVGTALDRATDQTRCLLLTLRGRNPTTDQERRDYAAHFAEIQEKIAALPKYLSTRLFKRMIGLVHVVRDNAEMFRRLIAAKYASSRVGDQIGTVLAGVYALEHSSACDEKTAAAFLSTFPWDDYAQGNDQESLDEGHLITHLCAHHLRVETPTQVVTRTVGELCAIVSAPPPQNPDDFDGAYPIDRNTARACLDRVGIAWAPAAKTIPGAPAPEHVFWLSNTHPELKKIFSNSQFSQGYQAILSRIGGGLKCPYSRSFAGAKSKAALVPRARLLG